ncbi:sensor domain-containing diguanylate cyclase [Sphingomonas solaris]|uniref:GGDEF domain-containing protein n=1 Tax=Alterirhizorhabdus solaris TaxID=2529389 RepID=UPI0013968838|nr:GGDEF domain-containing protein [Sphingomonas solaris]
MIGRLSAASSKRSWRLDGIFAGSCDEQGGLFRRIGKFLADHRLEPTPANYALAHVVVTDGNATVLRAVAEATFGDVRLTQAQADRIGGLAQPVAPVAVPVADTQAAAAAMADLMRSIDDARERFERFAGIVDTSRRDAQDYGDALVSGAATLTPVASAAAAQAETLAALLALTQSMIGKTRSAEEQLRAASVEMDDLRASLAAARQDAGTDPLTGLPNRRAFETRFADLMNRPIPCTVSLAMCDIDMFKGINDRHGHDVGDRVIRLVGKQLADGCDDAVVARYGGEEFVMLFDGCDAVEAAQALDATRAAISARSFKVAGSGETLERLSFSGGVVTVAPGEAVRDAVRRADTALYRAKQDGRNRIELGI